MPAQWPAGGGGRPGRVAGIVVLALLLGLAAGTVAGLRPPAPAPASAPATAFSADRAAAHVREIAAETHVAGSDADGRVVDRLVDTLTGLGLDARVQYAVGTGASAPGSVEMGRVRNVVGFLPGSAPTGRIYLMAHHDSVQNGPGGSDDGSGVSTLLETVRALKAGPPLRNDVVVVLTDAEEACLCGAEAFAASHPLAAGGVVLNFEARGTTGPPIMFETSRGNAGLAAVFADAAPHPVASSFAVEVYRALPNDTDFSVMLRDGGFTGLNTAFIDGAAAYHTPQDTPERLDRRSLQAEGDNALALTRALGGRDLGSLTRPAAEDATYFPLLTTLLRYPGSWVTPLAGAALLAVVVLVGVARRRGAATLGRTAGGAALALLPLALGPLAAQGLWLALVALRPGYAAMLDPWRPGWYRLAVVALVVAVVLVWYALLRRRLGPTALMVGGLIWPAVLGAILAWLAPGGSYLAALPALAGALAGLVLVTVRSAVVRTLAVLLAGAVAVIVLAPTVALFLPALGLSSAAAPSFVVALLAMALLPAVEFLHPAAGDGRSAGRLQAAAVPVTAVVAALACAAAGLATDRFDAAHPVPSQLMYALDADSGRAWWASAEQHPGDWTRRYVHTPGSLPLDFPYLAGAQLTVGQAQAAALAPPAVTTVSDTVVGSRREISLRVTPQRPGVRLLALDVTVGRGTVTRAAVAGRDVPAQALGRSRLWLTFHAPGTQGVEVAVTVEGAGPVTVRAVDGSDGLSGLPGYASPPEGVDTAGTHGSGLVAVSATTTLG